ncbi:MAG TPA: DUF4124 domain-containing protein [Xanthomonadaceae bacterium]|nr:DUF4124 domain-containing protein [Xanthomonadaceae bacterium]
MTVRWAGLLLACACAIGALAAAAAAEPARASIVIYRCTDVFGRLTVQNDVPCPKGARQETQVVDAPPPIPAYQPIAIPEPAPPPVPLVAGEPASPPPPAPPPPLFQCSTPEGGQYFSEAREPEPRCVPLQVVGLDGSAQRAGGAACEIVRDHCTPIPEDQTCDAWQRRLREAETAWRFGRGELAAQHEAEFERIGAIVAASNCGQPPASTGDAGR